jgi:hypothetical protein
MFIAHPQSRGEYINYLFGTGLSRLGIYQCIFKNITGPAISITGGNTSAGYGPWVFTTDNCIFEECGSATEPVVEYGVSWLGVLSNSRIVTQSRPVYAGFKGCFGIIDNVQMNLNMTDNTAMYLGHQRWEKTAGVGGSRVTNVTANGDIEFLDFDTYVRNYENGNYYNATLYQGKPWAFTYLFYNVNSTNVAEQYALYKDGQRAVDLSGYAQCEPTGIKPRDHGNGMAPVNLQRLTGPKYLYDIRGRKIGVLRQGNMPNFDTGSGVYLEKIQNVKVMRKLHM